MTMTSVNNTTNDDLIHEIRQGDVLCGKRKNEVNHPGSQNFRSVIDEYAPKYQLATTKQEKMNVTKEIYDKFDTQGSRFLKRNANDDAWEQLSSLLARDKISHALRFANRDKNTKKSNTTTKKNKKRGHRRTGSDSTVETAATELSQEDLDFLLLDDGNNNEPWIDSNEPLVYPLYESAQPPASSSYHHYDESAYMYSHHNEYENQPYCSQPQTYYQPQSHYQYPEHEPMMDFPAKPQSQGPVRENSMDIDISYIMSEPLMEWDLEPEQMMMANQQ